MHGEAPGELVATRRRAHQRYVALDISQTSVHVPDPGGL